MNQTECQSELKRWWSKGIKYFAYSNISSDIPNGSLDDTSDCAHLFKYTRLLRIWHSREIPMKPGQLPISEIMGHRRLIAQCCDFTGLEERGRLYSLLLLDRERHRQGWTSEISLPAEGNSRRFSSLLLGVPPYRSFLLRGKFNSGFMLANSIRVIFSRSGCFSRNTRASMKFSSSLY